MIARLPLPRLSTLSGSAVFLLSLLSFSAAAELRGVTEEREPAASTRPSGLRVRRFEQATGKSYKETAKQLQPDRVYVVHIRGIRRWVYVSTDGAGKFPSPMEAMAPGTVVKGASVGGDSGKRYRLTKEAKWVPTKDPIQSRLWTLTRKPKFGVFVPFEEGPTRRKPASKK